jgi:hypothetical protein
MATVPATVGAAAANDLSALIPEPASTDWQRYAPDTGELTAADVYGSNASSVQGFSDAYRKVWTSQDQVLSDRVTQFSSTLWVSVRLGAARAADARVTGNAVVDISGYGQAAYEVRVPADANGFVRYAIVFGKGDYLAVVSLANRTGPPSITILGQQADLQQNLIPAATAETARIGAVVILGGLGLLAVVAVVIVVIVVMLGRNRRRRVPLAYAPGVQAPPAGGLTLSPDRRYWWDGVTWQDTAFRLPPGAGLSPDGRSWWDGVTWRPVP